MKASLFSGIVESLAWSTAGAIGTTLLLHHEYGEFTQICGDVLCWALVLLWFEILPLRGAGTCPEKPQMGAVNYLPWIAAGGIAISSLSSSFTDVRWITPILTPSLLALRRLNPTLSLPRFNTTFPLYVQSIWIQTAIALGAVLALAPPVNTTIYAIAVVAALALLLLYASLVTMLESSIDLSANTTHVEFVHVLRAIISRAMPMLLLAVFARILLYPVAAFHISEILIIGVLKAVHWILLFRITQHAPWEIATTILTFTEASAASLSSTSDISVALLVLTLRFSAAIVALFQTIIFLPKSTRGRNLLLIFAICPFIPFLQNYPIKWGGGFALDHTRLQKGTEHPIEYLILKSQADLNATLARQSKTINDAVAEYKRRYNRDPPRGFEGWFQYAKSHDSQFIDEFDQINEDLKPFWRVPPKQLRKSVEHCEDDTNLALRRCGVKDGKWQPCNAGWIGDAMSRTLVEVVSAIPDVPFAIDVIDEPREIISNDILEEYRKNPTKDVTPQFYNLAHTSIWDHVVGPCNGTTPKVPKETVFDYGIPFVQDIEAAKDVCQHPEFGTMHGMFASPETFMLTDFPIPMVSQSKPSSFGDILYPSPWYTDKYDQGAYVDNDDPPWEQKKNTLYWAGSTTGSHSSNGSWQHAHRQRFVTTVKHLKNSSHTYLSEAKPGVWQAYNEREILQQLYDVHLTAVIQCDEDDCETQRKFFHPDDREEGSAQYHSRFVFDLDGNSFSGRYYTLLQSRSVVLKQTVLKEWHDERLFPWVHYVPVSLSMEELPETMRYLALTENGAKRAREIADQSRQWQGKALRKVDATIYNYRLLLELARVMDESRAIE